MPVYTLVGDVYKVVESLCSQYDEYRLAMLYNSAPDLPSGWNLIISADWTDDLGIAEATRIIARELHNGLGLENRAAISRVTVLKTKDEFVQDMVRWHPYKPSPGSGYPVLPVSQLMAGGVTGAAFVFYSQAQVPV